MKNFLTIFSLIILLPSIASAKIDKGITLEKPTEIEKYITSSVPYGKGEFHWFILHVYNINLWTDSKNFSLENIAKEKFALSINYKIKVSRDDFVKTTIEEMVNVTGQPAQEFEKFIPELQRVFPSVKMHDVITAINIPNGGVKFFYNSKETGTIPDKNFAKPFFSIWLSEKTKDQKLYKKLTNK